MDDFNRRPVRRTVNLGSAPNDIGSRPVVRAVNQPPANNFGSVNETGAVQVPIGPKRKLKLRLPKNKKEWIIVAAAGLVLLGGSASALYWFVLKPDPKPVVQQAPEPEPPPPPPPTTGPSVVSGREVPLADVKRPIYAVQIENSPEARPQSGLIDADIVSEAVAEGGITRFNAIYHDKVPANIGPVRSLRPYYIDWFLPYNAGIVHAGGSPEALNDISALRLQDMNHNSTHFRRVSNRYAPHNLYTTGQQMLDLFTSKGYKNADPIPSLPRKAAAPAEVPTAKAINLNVSRSNYAVSYTWDPASNKYLRNLGGVPHKDADNGLQIAPDVVVVPIMTKGVHPDRVHTVYGTVGSGKVFIFQDGTVTEGTWHKSSRQAQWEFKDAAGNPIKLNPGQTWFTMIDAPGSVTYTP